MAHALLELSAQLALIMLPEASTIAATVSLDSMILEALFAPPALSCAKLAHLLLTAQAASLKIIELLPMDSVFAVLDSIRS